MWVPLLVLSLPMLPTDEKSTNEYTETMTTSNVLEDDDYDDIEKLKYALMKDTADPNHEDIAGDSPLTDAVWYQDYNLSKLLLEKGADPNHEDALSNSPLNIAAWNDDVAIADLLLKHGADPNHEDTLGNTPLNDAIFSDDATFQNLLIEHGANPYHTGWNDEFFDE